MPEQSLSETTVYGARPLVRVDGEEPDEIRQLLLAAVVRFQEGGLGSAELRFSNVASQESGDAAWAFEDGRVLAHGKTVTISMGDEEDPTEIFEGKISAIEAEFGEGAPPELVVYVEDALFAGRLTRRTKVYEDLSVADLVSQVAQEHGLTPDVSGLSGNARTWVQLNESDLAFLRRVLDQHDADLEIADGKLAVTPRADRSGDTVTVGLNSQLRSARFMADLAHQVTTVTVSGFDVAQGEAVRKSVSSRSPGPGAGRAGHSVLSDALGDRSEHVGDLRVSNDGEGQALAEAAFDQRARRFVTLDGTLQGNPAVRIGTRLEVTGVGPRFENTYEVTAVIHRFDLESGYQTDVHAVCAFLGES